MFLFLDTFFKFVEDFFMKVWFLKFLYDMVGGMDNFDINEIAHVKEGLIALCFKK